MPLDLKKEAQHHLLQKFSRNPIWEAVNSATEKALPKWGLTSRPHLAVRRGTAVWEYRLPQDFSSVKSYLKTNKQGGKRFAHKALGNPRQVATGVKATSLEKLLVRFDGPVADKHGNVKESQLSLEEVHKILNAHEKAFEQWHEDRFRVTILWESIIAALAASWCIWNRYDAHFGGEKEEDYLNYLAPFFEATGIDVKRVWEIAFKVPFFGEGKKPKFIPGKPVMKPLVNYYLAKEYVDGKMAKQFDFEGLPELQQKILRAATGRSREALIAEMKAARSS